MRPLTSFLAAFTIASAAHAEDRAQAYDPNQLPSYRGKVQLFTLTPPGDIDGLILTDGTEIKAPRICRRRSPSRSARATP